MKPVNQRISNFDARSVLLIAAFVVGGSTSLQAQPVSPAPQTQSGPSSTMPAPAASGTAQTASFDRADANHDGHLSAKEAQNLPEIGNRFAEMDKNHDGQLSREEFEAGARR